MNHDAVQTHVSDNEKFQTRRSTNPFWNLVLFAGVLFWLVALVVRIVFRDSLPYVSALYYATPPAVLAVIAIVLAFMMWRMQKHSRSAFWMLLAASCLVWTLSESVVVSNKSIANIQSESIRVAFWNAARGRQGWGSVAKDASKLDADVIGLVEAGVHSEERRAFWKSNFPNHHVSLLGGGFVLLTRGEASECTVGDLDKNGETRSVDVTVRGQQVRIIIADVHSNPFKFRKIPLDALAKQAKDRSEIPTIIMGDFNTPTESIHLKSLREDFTNAFEIAGNGYAPTWPAPLPLITLDHIWVSKDIELSKCELGWSWVSDHRPVISEITIKPSGLIASRR